jgi:hypothetical protein
MKYRKTALIEATQFNNEGDHPAVFADERSQTGLAIYGLENTVVAHEVTPSDWIAGTEGRILAHQTGCLRGDLRAGFRRGVIMTSRLPSPAARSATSADCPSMQSAA